MLILSTSFEVSSGEVYLAQSWQRTLDADSPWSEELQ